MLNTPKMTASQTTEHIYKVCTCNLLFTNNPVAIKPAAKPVSVKRKYIYLFFWSVSCKAYPVAANVRMVDNRPSVAINAS